ncbi:uncharacterized protein LOC109117946 [Fukomys damarensis]|uniref:uncharacterized protein LOC109117946 n=1 Tax=Fukomys damarensis TaxID=885580 RepID=UPI0008FED131|nr:uncharacterized protein LOC109117946 [Fukomys damarensis]
MCQWWWDMKTQFLPFSSTGVYEFGKDRGARAEILHRASVTSIQSSWYEDTVCRMGCSLCLFPCCTMCLSQSDCFCLIAACSSVGLLLLPPRQDFYCEFISFFGFPFKARVAKDSSYRQLLLTDQLLGETKSLSLLPLVSPPEVLVGPSSWDYLDRDLHAPHCLVFSASISSGSSERLHLWPWGQVQSMHALSPWELMSETQTLRQILSCSFSGVLIHQWLLRCEEHRRTLWNH